MPNENAGVQEPVEKPVEAVETKPTAAEADPETVISQLLDENKKLATERENYRLGMLKAKRKLPEDVEPEDEDLDAKIDRKVNERLLNTQWAESQQRLEDEAKKLARENKELKKSILNRSQVSTTNQVTSHDSPQVRDTSIPPEKEKELMARFTGSEEVKRRKLDEWKKNRFGK